MSILTMIILIILYLVYFISFVFIFRWTFKYNTINKFAFRKGLQNKNIIHYLELAMVILLFIGVLTSLISILQILCIKKG